jgi:hypothetical protein
VTLVVRYVSCRQQIGGSSFFLFLLFFWIGLHHGIYKGSYNISNISYLNSPPPPFSFISHPPNTHTHAHTHTHTHTHHSWNSFNRYHFSIYIHVHTILPYSPSYTLSPPPPHPTPTGINTLPPPKQDLFHPLVLQFCRRKKNYIFA